MGMLDLYVAIYVLDGLSMLCSLASIIIVLWVWYKQPSSKESPSFNLSLWIAISDFPLRIADIVTNPLTFMGNYPSSHSFALFLMWISFFSAYWFIYLNAMITLDLQLVFFHRLPRQARIRRWYPLIGTAIAFFAAFWYLILPDVRLTPDGVVMVGTEGSVAAHFLIVWTNMWMHIGIVYAFIVVICVCIKVFRSQSHLRRFDQGEHAKAMSKALVRNTRLIIAYPIIMFVVYVPYVLASWFGAYIPGPFAGYWNAASNVLYSMQGIFNFVILLFHPVMLSTYRHNNFGFSSLWSRVSRRMGTNTAGTYNSSTGATPGPSGQTGNSSYSMGQSGSTGLSASHMSDGRAGMPMGNSPHLQTLDMGPGVTGFFGSNFENGQGASVHKLRGLEGMEAIEAQAAMVEKGDMFPLLDDPTCL
ncbi:hypothetical protein IWQ60_007385 [Tieghemiomyces parasiticus]|uniref:Uncharacterized protein n=1 Tax=Tieghemiomyces parasiticus TaxID=78921 RepID=A0A9W7ZXR7_9FUNG|nr:hypothetical protein IWQ60_007385 [Tieghemiomyces parasiticus]